MCPPLVWRKGTKRRVSRSAEGEFQSSASEPRVVEKESAFIEGEPLIPAKRDKIVNEQDLYEKLSGFNPLNNELEDNAATLSVYESPVTGKILLDEGTKSVFTRYILSEKAETMIFEE